MFYLTYWMSPNRLANYSMYCGLSLASCSVVQDKLCAKGGIPQETRNAMEKLCRTMQSLIIEHLTSALPITLAEVHGAGIAVLLAYTYLTTSRCTFEDEVESCKPYVLKCLSSLGLVIDNIVLMQIYCTYATYYSTPA